MSTQFMRRKTNRKFRNEEGDEALVGLLDGSDNEDTANEDINLPVKRKPQINFIEHKVEEGDTLSSLSLQFNCTISQLKQYNNIHRDNEIFALRVVRIPVIPFSIVTEKLAGAQNEAPNVGNLLDIVNDNVKLGNSSQDNVCDTSVDPQLSGIGSASDISVCNPLLTPLPIPVLPSLPIDLTHEVEAPEIEILPSSRSSFLNCNGADCGIPWLMLFVCTLAIGFVGPLVYIFLLYEEKKHHSDDVLSS